MGVTLVLFAHGSRDPLWAAPLRALKAKIAARDPSLRVELAFLELMQPDLYQALDRIAASGGERVHVAPIFMAQGAHLRRDLAGLLGALRERHPQLDIALLPAAGEIDAVLEAMGDWLVAAAHRGDADKGETH
jgi:sirohydrochlorin cobaltochelatase